MVPSTRVKQPTNLAAYFIEQLNNSTKHSPSWVANSNTLSYSRKSHRFTEHGGWLLRPPQSATEPSPLLPICFHNIILPSTPKSSRWYFQKLPSKSHNRRKINIIPKYPNLLLTQSTHLTKITCREGSVSVLAHSIDLGSIPGRTRNFLFVVSSKPTLRRTKHIYEHHRQVAGAWTWTLLHQRQ
jgi:hypothetical protein